MTFFFVFVFVGFTTTQDFGIGVQYRRGTGGPQLLSHAESNLDVFRVTGHIADPDRTVIGATLVPGFLFKLWNIVPVMFAAKPMGGIMFQRHKCPTGKIYYTLVGKLDVEAGLAAISLDIPGTTFSFEVSLEGGLPWALVVTPVLLKDLECGVCAGCIGLRPSLEGSTSVDLTAVPTELPDRSPDAAADARCAALSTCALCSADPTCRWCQDVGDRARDPTAGLCAARALECDASGTNCKPGEGLRLPRGAEPAQCTATVEVCFSVRFTQ